MTFAPAAMTVEGRHTAAADGSITFWGPGVLRLRLYLARGPVEIAVEARGSSAAGAAPTLEARLDGRAIGSWAVPPGGARTHSFATEVGNAHEALIEIAFTNFHDGGTPLSSRVVSVRRLAVRSPAD